MINHIKMMIFEAKMRKPDTKSTTMIGIKGFRSYFKVVVLAPFFCGESSFRVIRDLSECIFSGKEKISHF